MRWGDDVAWPASGTGVPGCRGAGVPVSDSAPRAGLTGSPSLRRPESSADRLTSSVAGAPTGW